MATKAMTESEKATRAVLAVLEQAGKVRVRSDAITFDGDKITLPATFAGPGGIDKAVEYLTKYQRAQEAMIQVSREFPYRVWDGAHAFQAAMMSVFGTAGLGVTTKSMFGEQLPQMVTINTSATATTQVPWGLVSLDQLACTFELDSTMHEDYGQVFVLHARLPKKFRGHVEVFFDVVSEYLRTNSIYRGRAIDGGGQPSFIDTSKVDENKIVYNQDTLTQLDANFYSLITYSDEMRKLGLPLKRSVLLEGPYGTGKTLAGMLAAKKAEQNGWTFILCRPGKDDLTYVLQTAQLYSPAVVWFEDIDTVAGGGIASDQAVSKVLDLLDSVTTKGTEVIAGFTTNHIQKIQKGVLRPGRLDAVINIGVLDQAGFEKLIKLTIPGDRLSRNIDFDLVANAMQGFLPAFVKEAADRAVRYSMAANGGTPRQITTDDLVNAAIGLRPQLTLMNEAQEGPKPRPQLDQAFQGAMAGMGTRGRNDDPQWMLVPGSV